MIRPATPDDAVAIAAIWNDAIRNTTQTFNPVEKHPDDLAVTLAAAGPYGWFVADVDGVTGFAGTFGFRSGQGYRHTAEHTIYLADAARGQGLGHALMEAVEDHARSNAIHSLFAGVSAENPGGVAFHAKRGFRTVATLPQVGRKFDRWIDLILMQKML